MMATTTSAGNKTTKESPTATINGGTKDGGVVFRKVTLQDLDQLQEISRKTFVDTYGSSNDPEYINKYLSTSFSKEKLTCEIQNPQSQFFLAVATTTTANSNNSSSNNHQTQTKADADTNKKATTATITNQQKIEGKAEVVVVGYLKINWGKAQTEQLQEEENDNKSTTTTTTTTMEIERIYVLKEYAGRGIGRAFIDKAMDFANKHGGSSAAGGGNVAVSYLWLGVWEQNTTAIGFYKKVGFEPFGTHIFDMGGDKQTDILMKKNLLL